MEKISIKRIGEERRAVFGFLSRLYDFETERKELKYKKKQFDRKGGVVDFEHHKKYIIFRFFSYAVQAIFRVCGIFLIRLSVWGLYP